MGFVLAAAGSAGWIIEENGGRRSSFPEKTAVRFCDPVCSACDNGRIIFEIGGRYLELPGFFQIKGEDTYDTSGNCRGRGSLCETVE